MVGALKAFYWEIKMDIKASMRYRFALFSDIIVFSILFSIFLFTDTGKSYKSFYKYSNYKEFIVIGYIAWMYAVTAISSISQIVSGELHMGTFYKKCNSKYPLQFLLLGHMVASLLTKTIIAIVLLLLANLIWGVEVTFHVMIILSIIISTLGMYGIGLIVAGLTIFYKRTGPLIFIIQMGLLFITDTVPASDRTLSFSRILPLTSCNLIIKYILTRQYFFKEFIFLCFTTAVFLILGTLCFHLYFRKAKIKGNLLFY